MANEAHTRCNIADKMHHTSSKTVASLTKVETTYIKVFTLSLQYKLHRVDATNDGYLVEVRVMHALSHSD